MIETFRIALNALGTNRLRALLTTLGIMIGVAAVVSLMSLGGSLQSYIQGQFESLNANVLNISASRGRFTASGTQPLTTADVEGLQDPTVAPHVVAVAATYTVRGNIGYGATSESASIEGVTVNYGDVNNWHVGSGRFITDKDVTDSERGRRARSDSRERPVRHGKSGRADDVGRQSSIYGRRRDGRTRDQRLFTDRPC